MTKKICAIYRCSKKQGMYIYLDKDKDMGELPDALKKLTGRLELAMTLVITPAKKLAHAPAEDVLAAIDKQGFYLQMPPTQAPEHTRDAISQANQMLER
ncbi:MAG: YcgL domain-containing protein [Pseudomonadota bacterium]